MSTQILKAGQGGAGRGRDLLCFIPDPTADKQFLTRNKLVTAMRINLEDNQGLAEKEVTKGINN